MADSANPFAIQFLSAIPAALASFPMERKRRRDHPGTLPYTWGIFVGLQTVVLGAFLGLLWGVSLFGNDTDIESTLMLFVGTTFYAASGLFVLRRYRWAWVLATILSLNPAWWIANAIYGRNRWSELTTSSVPRIFRRPTESRDARLSEAPPSGTATQSLSDQLRELDALHKEGILSDDEFGLKKRQLLGL